MSITVANLVAQVGADLTQFKLGMNEVDARLAQVKVRGEQAMRSVAGMRAESARQANIATALRQQRVDLAPMLASQRAVVAAARTDAAAYKAMWDQAQAAQIAAMRSGDAALKASAKAAVTQAKLAYKDIAADAKLAETELNAMEARAAALSRRATYASKRSGVLLSRAGSVEATSGAAEDVSVALARRRAQDAAEHRTRALNNIAGSAMAVGAVAEVGLGVAAEVGANFSQMMVQTAHNTQLTTQGLVVMNATVKQLGLESGASFEELAHGFRLLTDYGFNAAKSQQMLRAAMKGSIATGTDLATTAELLAKATKEFNLPAEQSNKTMALLVETGRRSTLTMDQMVNVGGKLYATAANMGMSFVEANAALITFTQHGLSSSQAATQLTNDVNKITHPVKQVRDLLGELDKWTGKKLADDFNSVGFRARHMKGVFDDIVATFDSLTKKQREQLHVQTPSDLASKIFPNLRGTVGAVIATGTGFKDFQTNIDNLTKSLDKGGQIDDMYAESMKQLNQQMGRMQNAGTILASTVANALVPSVLKLTNTVVADTKAFDALPDATKEATVKFIAIAGAALIGFGAMGKLIVGVSQLKVALIELGVAEDALKLSSLGAAAGPVVIGLFAVAAAMAAVYGIAKVYDDTAASVTNEQVQQANSSAALAGRALDHATAVNSLVQQYDKLHNSTDKSKAKMAELHDVLLKIQKLSPDLISGFDGQGNALGLIASAANNAADGYNNMAAAAAKAKLSAVQLSNQQNSDKLDDLNRRRNREYWQVTNKRDLPEGMANVDLLPQGYKENLRELSGPELQMHQQALRDIQKQEQAISDQNKQAIQDVYIAMHPHAPGKSRNSNLPYTGPPATAAPHYGGGDDSKSKKEKESAFQQAMDQARQKLDSLRQAYYGMSTEGDAADALWERQSGNLKLVTAGLYGQILAQAKLNDEMRKYKAVQSDIDAAGFDAKKRKIEDAGGPNKNYNELMLEFTDPKGKYAHVWNMAKGAGAQQMSDLVTPLPGAYQMQEGVKRWPYKTKYGDETYASRSEAAGAIDWETQQPYKDKLADVELLRKKGKTSENDAWDPFFIILAQSLKGNTPEERLKEFEAALKKTGRGIIKFPSNQGAFDNFKKDAGVSIPSGMATMPILPENLRPLSTSTRPVSSFTARYKKQVDDLIALAKGQDKTEGQQSVDKDMGSAKDYIDKITQKTDTPQQQAIAFLKEHADAYKALQVTGKAAIDVLVAANVADAKTLQALIKPGEDAVNLFADLAAAKAKEAEASKKRAEMLAAEKTEGVEANKYLSDSLRKAKDDLLKASSNKDDVKEGARSEFIAGYMDKNKMLFADPNVSQKEKDRLVQVANAQFELVYATNLQAKAAIEVRDINKQVDKGLKDISDTMHHVTDGITITDAQWKKMSRSQQDAFNKLKQMTQVKSLMGAIMEGTEQIVYNSMMRIREHGFKGVFTQILQDFDNMLFELAAKWLSSQFLQLLQNQIPRLMGMAFGAAAGGGGGGVTVTNEPITANALGGPLERGRRYLVGENQAEYASVDAAGNMRMDPANRGTRGGGGQSGGGDIVVNNHFTVYATDARSFANTNTQTQLHERSAAAARLAMNRNR